MRRLLPAFGCFVIGVLVVLWATHAEKLECNRSTCEWSTRLLWLGSTTTFRVADVREVRFSDNLGKGRNQAESILVFANGTQLTLARDDEDDAAITHATLRDFFAPTSTTPLLELAHDRKLWLLLFAAVPFAGAISFAMRRHAPTPPSTKPKMPARKKLRIAIAIGIGAIVIGIIQLAMFVHADRTQGTLHLICKQRCRFNGMECLPGGEIIDPLDPGTYQIEIWASSGSALWIPKTFEITLGETTRFTCE